MTPRPGRFLSENLGIAENLRLLAGLKLSKVGRPGAYLACLVIYGPVEGHRHWTRRGVEERDTETET